MGEIEATDFDEFQYILYIITKDKFIYQVTFNKNDYSDFMVDNIEKF